MPGLQPGDPVLHRMLQIIHSTAGMEAAVTAADAGKPAMAGVDPLLRKELSGDYNKETQGPQRAGWEVNKVLRAKGFQEMGKKTCGGGCLCGKATFWVSKKGP